MAAGSPAAPPVEDLAHVVVAGQAQQAGVPGQRVLDLVERQAGHPVQVEDHGRVDVAAAGAHHQAAQRGHAHRGGHAAAAPDRAGAGAVAQVQRDHVGLGRRVAEQRGGAAGDVRVRRAVEAVPPDLPPLGERRVDRPGDALGRDGRVERGVEDRHLRHVGQQLAGHLDAGQRGRVVQRRERDQLLDRGDHLVVDHRRRGELACRRARPGGRPRPARQVESSHDPLQRRVVVGRVAAGLADPLDQALGQRVAVAVEERGISPRRSRC